MTNDELEGRLAALEISAQFAVQAWGARRPSSLWGENLFPNLVRWFSEQIDDGHIPSPPTPEGKEAMKAGIARMFNPKDVIPGEVLRRSAGG